MARKRRKGSRRRRGVGSVIRVSQVGGIADPKSVAGSLLPVLIGGGVTIAVTVGVRQYVEPKDESDLSLIKNAPLIGGAAGLVVGGVLWAMKMQPAGLAAGAGALVAALGMWGLEYAAQMKAEAMAEAATAPGGTAGLRAIVPEYGVRGTRGLGSGRGMGAIVMEPSASRGNNMRGAYGETVNLGGINPGAFGTPGFHFGGR
jgi:hypothetical protein